MMYVWAIFALYFLPFWVHSQPLEISHQQASEQDFSGIDGFSLTQSRTVITFPLIDKQSRPGRWQLGPRFSENRFQLSGVAEGERRFYSFSLPVQYNTRQIGKVSYQWLFEPAYFTDESLIEQRRFEMQFHWQMRYHVNSKASWVLGAARDSGFGARVWYPRVGLISLPKPGIKHHWVFPNVYSQFALNRDYSLRIHYTREGGQWLYRPEAGGEATLSYQQWDMGLRLLRRSPLPFYWMLGVGIKQSGEATIAGFNGDLSSTQYIIFGITTAF